MGGGGRGEDRHRKMNKIPAACAPGRRGFYFFTPFQSSNHQGPIFPSQVSEITYIYVLG